MSFRRVSTLAVLAAALGASMLSSPVRADVPLAPATFSGGIHYFPFTSSLSTFGASSASHTDTFGTVSAAIGLDPQTATVSGASTAIGDTLIADARLKYQFAILSGTPGSIHVLVDTSTTAGGGGSYFAEAEVDLNAKDGTLNKVLAYSHACAAINGCSGVNNKFADGGLVDVILTANKIYSITLFVDGHTGNANSSFSAFADPTFSFDPNFEHPADAVFAFSSNLSPVLTDGGVPEPATWAMMLMGFGGLGAMLRRRRGLAVA